ncbi:MAG: phytanoyl-CoA dioxygenase family protein [Alphaproteobacteria bacterium]|nr:phytanoyl-CoA dioxygenase family protein [Alphaproteobacteria bacterium]
MSLERDGFVLVERVVDVATIAHLRTVFMDAAMARSERDGETYGARNLLGVSAVRDVLPVLREIVGGDLAAVRGLFFDKTEAANWPVPWHQDLTLALAGRCEMRGWSNWSIKRGVHHAQPPAGLLARMVTLRLHLDDCGADNGPLRIVAGSHAHGILPRDEIRARTASQTVVTARAGDALVMRPLILHASSPATRPGHRRVLHVEFAPPDLLPSGLVWAEAA